MVDLVFSINYKKYDKNCKNETLNSRDVCGLFLSQERNSSFKYWFFFFS